MKQYAVVEKIHHARLRPTGNLGVHRLANEIKSISQILDLVQEAFPLSARLKVH